MTEPATVTVSTAQPEDFFQLLKPRVMSLVIFTAVTGLVVAGGDLDWLSAAIAILCIAVGAGAAGALNMALEGETDALMRRTRGRPVAAGRVNKNDAMTFGVILSVFSVMLLGMTTNWLAGGLLLMTILYYAVFYTLLLKRRTPQNIVIGGAAGPFRQSSAGRRRRARLPGRPGCCSPSSSCGPRRTAGRSPSIRPVTTPGRVFP